MNIPIPVKEFLKSAIEFEEIFFLPHFYPTEEEFSKFQEGYRFNPVSNEDLVGTKNGDWQKDWYVIASSYSANPFFVKFDEQSLQFPVYFAWNGMGRWEPIKVSTSIDAFKALLQDFKVIETDPQKSIDYIQAHLDVKNPFWSELLEELQSLLEDED